MGLLDGWISARAARLCLMAAGLVVASALGANAAPVPAEAGPANAPRIKCNASLYRFLPGEVNLCLAAKEQQRNNVSGTVEMLKLAAAWGSKKAQYVLGVMYFNGDQMAADRPLGLAWLGLAAERGDPVYSAVLISAYGKASAQERAASKSRYEALRPVYADVVAARRAERQFDRAMRDLTRFEPYPSQVCIPGLVAGITDADADDGGPMCPSASVAVAVLNEAGDAYFEGWAGHVSVGSLEPVKDAGYKQPPEPREQR